MTGLYERIAEQAERKGWTGKELGKLLGLKKSPLTDWKNKKSCPTLEQVALMCDIFAVSSDYLIFGKSSFLSVDEANLLDGYRDLDTFGKQRIHNFIHDELARISPDATSQKIG